MIGQDGRRLPIVDALQSSKWDRALLEEWRKGGLDCVHVTCALWEDARVTLGNIATWYRLARENGDVIGLVDGSGSLQRIIESGRIAVVMGFQNTSPIEDDIDLVEVFYRLGVRVMQLTYNNQSLVGGSCYERYDSGLTRYGREVVREMNRVGMLIDLSHVGEQTCLEAIELSERPVAVTHANPSGLWWYTNGLLRTTSPTTTRRSPYRNRQDTEATRAPGNPRPENQVGPEARAGLVGCHRAGGVVGSVWGRRGGRRRRRTAKLG